MIINDLDGYYIVFDTKNWNTELDTLVVFKKKAVFNSLNYEGNNEGSRMTPQVVAFFIFLFI